MLQILKYICWVIYLIKDVCIEIKDIISPWRY